MVEIKVRLGEEKEFYWDGDNYKIRVFQRNRMFDGGTFVGVVLSRDCNEIYRIEHEDVSHVIEVCKRSVESLENIIFEISEDGKLTFASTVLASVTIQKVTYFVNSFGGDRLETSFWGLNYYLEGEDKNNCVLAFDSLDKAENFGKCILRRSFPKLIDGNIYDNV